ncbi:acyl-CoA thioesterase [Oligoflexus tunisiensis]|uniref:acyl-CoA thioesterase n=1 Tax=Oligoflexus tunisiensis TaxID=708132 RepID=UPI00159F3389|nr:acyl-CoA thioesterase [Oligoflexus tunisiensis]
MESAEYRYETVVKETMLDAMGHLNHASYLTVFEEARWDMCTAQGMTIEKMQARGIGLVVIEAHIQYRREVRGGEPLLIKTRFLDVHRKIWRVEQTMENAAGTVCSTLHLKGSMFDLRERKILLADSEWRAVFLGQGL